MKPEKLLYRMRVLPDQLVRARARVAQLEAEARRYRMIDLLTDGEAMNTHWELEVARSRMEGLDR